MAIVNSTDLQNLDLNGLKVQEPTAISSQDVLKTTQQNIQDLNTITTQGLPAPIQVAPGVESRGGALFDTKPDGTITAITDPARLAQLKQPVPEKPKAEEKVGFDIGGLPLNEQGKPDATGFTYNPETGKLTPNSVEDLQAATERKQSKTSAEQAGLSSGVSLSPTAQSALDIYNSSVEFSKNQVNELKANIGRISPLTQNLIDRIERAYLERIDEQKRINKNVLEGSKVRGIRAGRQRYAAEIEQGVLTDVEEQGFKKVRDLEDRRNELIQQATLAEEEEDWNKLNQRIKRK